MKSSHQKRKSEASLYEPVKKALHDALQPIGKCYLEISARSFISNNLKAVLTDSNLFLNLFERYIPDIMGYVEEEHAKPVIVVEVKPSEIKIRDIFQVKQYAQVFDAKYALLISPEPLPEEIKRILKAKNQLLYHQTYRQIFIGLFNEQTGKIDENSWYPEKLRKLTY